MIDNPEYKGEWQPRMIDNPNYKGEWVHPMIPNPDYSADPFLYRYKDNKFVGFEIWQVKAGTIFDNIIITDDMAEADKLAELTKRTQEAEKKMKEKEDEERRAQEATEEHNVEFEEEEPDQKDEL